MSYIIPKPACQAGELKNWLKIKSRVGFLLGLLVAGVCLLNTAGAAIFMEGGGILPVGGPQPLRL